MTLVQWPEWNWVRDIVSVRCEEWFFFSICANHFTLPVCVGERMSVDTDKNRSTCSVFHRLYNLHRCITLLYVLLEAETIVQYVYIWWWPMSVIYSAACEPSKLHYKFQRESVHSCSYIITFLQGRAPSTSTITCCSRYHFDSFFHCITAYTITFCHRLDLRQVCL